MEYNIDNIDLERFLTNSDIPQGFANFLMGTIIVFSVIVVICAVLILVAQIKMFKKGNQPGWAAIVPFYNQYVQCKMVGVNPWWILIVIGASFLGGIPVIGSLLTMAVSLYFTILLGVSTARAFGKDDAFAIGLILLPIVFYPILGFGKAEYKGADNPMNDFVFKKAEETINKTNSKFCPHCGSKMNKDSKFCPSCGKEVE